MPALLLNASFQAIRIISLRRAMTLVLTGRATMVEPLGEEWHTPNRTYPVPSVVRLVDMVKIPFSARVPLNRRALQVRDQGECQVVGCDAFGATVDHVIPRSRGGEHAWNNVVLMCAPHNERKGDRLLSEIGWELKTTPRTPRGSLVLLTAARTEPRDEWLPYLEPGLIAA